MYDNCYGAEPKGIFVDLTYDSGFKAVFADEANKTLLIGLLNEVLPPQAQIPCSVVNCFIAFTIADKSTFPTPCAEPGNFIH